MNRIILSGGLTKDAELREGPRGSVVSFRFAVRDFSKKKEDGTYESMYFNVTAYGAVGDRFYKFARKGTQVLVEGRVRQNSYKNQSGVTVTTTEIVADNIELIGGKDSKDSAQVSTENNSGYESDSEPVRSAQETSKNLDTVDVATDDLPF